jgi:hypothetical protein
MLRRVLAGLCVGFMGIFVTSCGQTYKLESITVTPAAGYILTNSSPQGALAVTANYSNTKTSVVTATSTYEAGNSTAPDDAAPLGVVTVDNSGVVTASGTTLACTYVTTTSGGVTTIVPYPYPVTVTYTENGVTATKTVPINVATALPCGTGQ